MAISDERSRLSILRDTLSSYGTLPGASDAIASTILRNLDLKDDCALLEVGNATLCITSDFIRGPGFYLFQKGLLTYADLGFLLVVANLSDIASMGASPVCIQTIVRYDGSLLDNDFKAIFVGIGLACSSYDCRVSGGDIGGYEAVVLAATAIGICQGRKPLLRSGAKEGDFLFVIGTVGMAASALMYFLKCKPQGLLALSDTEEADLLGSWRRPVPRLLEGVLLSASGLCTSCQDISDGLKATINEISAASNVQFELWEDSLPVSPVTKRIADSLDIDASALAMSASIDFTLVFTVGPDSRQETERLFAASGFICTCIGQAFLSNDSTLRRRNGTRTPLPGVEWRHQKGDLATEIESAAKNQN